MLSALALFLVACGSAEKKNSGDLPPPGTVVAERAVDMGFGFREVARSIALPSGAFEGIGHFSFVVYGGHDICQCTREDVVLSPDGQFLIYTDVESKKLMLFRSKSQDRVVLRPEFVGYPLSATWDIKAGTAMVRLSLGSEDAIAVTL